MNTSIQVSWLGLAEYTTVLELQKEQVQKVQKGGKEILLGLEHPSVITLGKRGGSVSNTNIPIIQTNRGGLATGHEPGQLVIYPIINLTARQLRVRTWVSILEKTITLALQEYNLHPKTGAHSGIWINEKKIASIGLHVVQGVSMHGISLNVHNTLSIFSQMDVCGVRELSMTSMKQEGVIADTKHVFLRIVEILKEWL